MAAEVIDAALATAGKPCELGNDPSKYLERFEDWYEHTSLLADSIGVKHDGQKLKLILLWGGRQFRKYAKEAGVVMEGEAQDTLQAAITKIRKQCGTHVNLSMAVFKLMHTRQGTKSVTEFARDIEELSHQCQFETQPYDKERAKKDAFIFGTSDDKVRQEALAKDWKWEEVFKAALGYEQSRKSSGAIKQTSGEEVRQVSYTQEDVDHIVSRVMAGKYSTSSRGSGASAPKQNIKQTSEKCRNCPGHYRPHPPGRCPAAGKSCVVCKGKGHFAGSAACTVKENNTVRSVDTAQDTYTYQNAASGGSTVGFVEVIEVGLLQESGQNNTVTVEINGTKTHVFVDSGCKKTLLPTTHFKSSMGEIKESQIRLRPYGTDQHLQVKGELQVTITAGNGAQVATTVYIVDGHLLEPLLGDEDAKALGILSIKPLGKCPRGVEVAGITDNLRSSGIEVNTLKEPDRTIPVEEKSRIEAIVERYPMVVHKDLNTAGLLRDLKTVGDAAVQFYIDPTVPPVAARYHPPPVAYQKQLSEHLQELRETDKIEDVDPKDHCPWISNVVITEKKQAGQIRMNIDMREPNKAIHRTQRHIETIQEIRHKLKGATRFSEIDLSHGYHQIPLEEESRHISTFQTHEGLHRFKVLFFGAAPASELFHEKIKTAMSGVPGCVSIHDNILVWGTDDKDHEHNLEATLKRMKERGLTARNTKCSFGMPSVAWFGWVFSETGMSADPQKIKSIAEAGRPQTCEDVKSFLQACQFNAKFMLESEQAYAQMTGPLRALTKKNAIFRWTGECERAYSCIMDAMTSETAVRPYDPKLKTKLVTDASPTGIAASVFQELEDGTLVPVDHASRALTPCEQNYSQIERESLGQAWGMNTHRYYLLGIPFESLTDHQPLVPIYSGRRKGNARVERHRLKVQGFQYEMKYLPGKENPCDYQSRHPIPLETFTPTELDNMVIDTGDELCISKIITDDIPDAVTVEMIQEATRRDPVMQRLIKAIQKGYIGPEPELKPYRQIFMELTHTGGMVLRGDKLVIPDVEFIPGIGLQQVIVDLAHEGHQGAVKCKQTLRAKVWFYNLDNMVESKIKDCIACQATTYKPCRDPLTPSPLPQRPWQKVDMDLWGPLPSGQYLLVAIDEYSRYPEVEFVHSTSAEAVIPHLDRIFSTHGFPESVKTDGGPPFNGTDTHAFKMYLKWAGIKHILVAPEDPEANGLAENFMKVIKKVWHTARIENKNFKQELYKYLRHYRATPHSTTKKAPAELLFNREIRTRLPSLQEPAQNIQVQEAHDQAKAKQKAYKDAKANVKPHEIRVGDKVLLIQKESKTQSRYDPDPYTVTEVRGHQITAVRGNKTRLRDAKLFKKVSAEPARNYHEARYPLQLHGNRDEFTWDIAGGVPAPQPVANAPIRQPENQNVGVGAHQQQQRRQHRYPNQHLEPNIDVTLQPGARRRQPPRAYDATKGTWN